MFKKTMFVLIVWTLFSIFSMTAHAEPNITDEQDLYSQLYTESGADDLTYAIPEQAVGFLDNIGFDDFSAQNTDDISFSSLISSISKLIEKNIHEPIKILFGILSIIIISTALDALQTSSLSTEVFSVVRSLCTVSAITPPILSLINELSNTISNSGNFMILYIPVISGLTIASGKPSEGSFYCTSMIYASSFVVQVTSRFVIPILKSVTALSIVSSLGKFRFKGVINTFKKISKFILTFCMSLFVAFLTTKSIITTSADNLSNKAVKFAVSSFVPLVGGALSDAYQTVLGSVSVLKSGVGTMAIIAVFAIFITAIVKCCIWQFVILTASAVCDIFGSDKTSSFLCEVSAIISIIFAILICTMALYIISTAILIISGG